MTGIGGATPLHCTERKRAVADSTAVTACAARLVEELKVDPSIALRFARARQGDFKKAAPFLRADLAWREMKLPVAQADCPTALASGFLRVLGRTPAGLTVLFCHLGLWDPSLYDVDEYERFMIYILEGTCQQSEQFVVLFDMRGWKLWHAMYMRNISRLFATLQDNPKPRSPNP